MGEPLYNPDYRGKRPPITPTIMEASPPLSTPWRTKTKDKNKKHKKTNATKEGKHFLGTKGKEFPLVNGNRGLAPYNPQKAKEKDQIQHRGKDLRVVTPAIFKPFLACPWMSLSSRCPSPLNTSIRGLNYLKARFPIEVLRNDGGCECLIKTSVFVIPECIYQESEL